MEKQNISKENWHRRVVASCYIYERENSSWRDTGSSAHLPGPLWRLEDSTGHSSRRCRKAMLKASREGYVTYRGDKKNVAFARTTEKGLRLILDREFVSVLHDEDPWSVL